MRKKEDEEDGGEEERGRRSGEQKGSVKEHEESDKERYDQRLVKKSKNYPELNSLHCINIRGLLLNKNQSKPTMLLDTLRRDNSEDVFLSDT